MQLIPRWTCDRDPAQVGNVPCSAPTRCRSRSSGGAGSFTWTSALTLGTLGWGAGIWWIKTLFLQPGKMKLALPERSVDCAGRKYPWERLLFSLAQSPFAALLIHSSPSADLHLPLSEPLACADQSHCVLEVRKLLRRPHSFFFLFWKCTTVWNIIVSALKYTVYYMLITYFHDIHSSIFTCYFDTVLLCRWDENVFKHVLIFSLTKTVTQERHLSTWHMINKLFLYFVFKGATPTCRGLWSRW